MASVDNLIKSAKDANSRLSRRKLRMALGSRTMRRNGCKKGFALPPRQLLAQAIEKAKLTGVWAGQ